MEKVLAVIIGVLMFLAIVIAVSAIPALIFWLLWGWIAVGVFGLPVLSFLQAWGLWFLLGMIGGLLRRSGGSGQ